MECPSGGGVGWGSPSRAGGGAIGSRCAAPPPCSSAAREHERGAGAHAFKYLAGREPRRVDPDDTTRDCRPSFTTGDWARIAAPRQLRTQKLRKTPASAELCTVGLSPSGILGGREVLQPAGARAPATPRRRGVQQPARSRLRTTTFPTICRARTPRLASDGPARGATRAPPPAHPGPGPRRPTRAASARPRRRRRAPGDRGALPPAVSPVRARAGPRRALGGLVGAGAGWRRGARVARRFACQLAAGRRGAA